MFGLSLGTFLVSKEIYILEHEYYTGLTFLLIWVVGVKKFGKDVANYLDAEIEKIENDWSQGRKDQIQDIKDGIEGEKKEQWRAEAQLMIIDAKKENVKMQLEAEYRSRAMNVYSEVCTEIEFFISRKRALFSKCWTIFR